MIKNFPWFDANVVFGWGLTILEAWIASQSRFWILVLIFLLSIFHVCEFYTVAIFLESYSIWKEEGEVSLQIVSDKHFLFGLCRYFKNGVFILPCGMHLDKAILMIRPKLCKYSLDQQASRVQLLLHLRRTSNEPSINSLRSFCHCGGSWCP